MMFKIDPKLLSSFRIAWDKMWAMAAVSSSSSSSHLTTDSANECCEYLRMIMTKKIVHARAGACLKRYGETFKEQKRTLLDFRGSLKALEGKPRVVVMLLRYYLHAVQNQYDKIVVVVFFNSCSRLLHTGKP